MAGHVKSGALRALAVTSPKRLKLLARRVPTMAEAGVPDVEVETWFALTAPKATPRGMVRRLNAEVVKAKGTTDLAKRYDELAGRPAGGSRDIVDAMIKSEVARWSDRHPKSRRQVDDALGPDEFRSIRRPDRSAKRSRTFSPR